MKLSLSDIVYEIEQFLWVETKDGRVVPFILNNIQRAFVKKEDDFKKNNPNKPVRIMVLKGRQFGISTLKLAILFIKCLLVDNTRAAVISHNDDATKKLFRRVRFFAKTLCVPPTLDKESEKEYSFPRTNSYFYIGTAGSKAWGRGDNLTDVHCSEVAFWENATTVMNGLIQGVGKTGNITIETTANGVGNYFHKLWKKSWNNPDAAWYAIFFKWTHFAEYEMDVPKNFVRTQEERELCRANPEMTDRKLAWRRWKISETEADKGLSPEDIFKQEYPLNPREAFISSGNAVFSLKALESYEAKPPVAIEESLYGHGEWKIWKTPSPLKYSIMAIDNSEGLENHDRTIIDIYDEKLDQVAQWAGYCDPDETADIAIPMAMRYDSYIINEVNNMGIAVQGHLRRKYPISKQYHRESFDEISKTKVKKIGFRTTTITKARAIGDLASAIRNHEIGFNCQETIDECMSYVKDGRGGFGAEEGSNDDRVITAALALQAFKDRPPRLINLSEEAREEKDKEALNKRWRAEKLKKFKMKQYRQRYAKR